MKSILSVSLIPILLLSVDVCGEDVSDSSDDSLVPTEISEGVDPVSPVFELPDDLTDPAFEKHVDISLVAMALETLQPKLLADVGLQIAEGERVLHRPHHAVSADQVLTLAVKAAAEDNDNETLERLARASETLGKKSIADAVESATQLVGDSRAILPGGLVSIDDISTDSLLLMRGYLDRVRRAKLLGDFNSLKELETRLKRENGLNKERSDYLLKLVQEAKETVPEDNDNEGIMLLASASRGWGLSDLDPTNRNSGIRQAGRNFDRERLKMMSRSPRPGRDYTKVHVRNGTSDTIWVAVRYVPFDFPSNDSTLAVYEPDQDGPFDTHAWFKLSSGERKHLANTANVHFYVYAENARGRRWSGSHKRPVSDNGRRRTIGFGKQWINAPHAESHTINVN